MKKATENSERFFASRKAPADRQARRFGGVNTNRKIYFPFFLKGCRGTSIHDTQSGRMCT